MVRQKKKYLRYFFTLSVLVMIFASCAKENRCDCFKSTGKTVTEIRPLDSFREMEIYNLFDVYLTDSNINEIRIEGGENLLPLVTTTVENNKLTIRNKNRCNWVRSYNKKIHLYVSTASLDNLILEGESHVTSLNPMKRKTFSVNNHADISRMDLNMDCDTVIFRVGGTGVFTLKGKTKFNYIWAFGTENIFSDNLLCEECVVYSLTTGDCHVFAGKKITVFLWESGNIYYSGNPKEVIIREETSTGRLYKK